ncbi:HNH endonuclease signature motif containing protein [Geodermatophilus sp. SYSU D00697]
MLDIQPPRLPETGVPVAVCPADLMGPGSELEHVADIWAADARAARAAAARAHPPGARPRRRRRPRPPPPRGRPARRRAGATGRGGLSAFVAELPTPDAHACADAVRRYAELLRVGGDDRPIGVLRAQVTRDLILRPWDTTRPPVTAQLTIHADLPALDPTAADQPAAEIDGQVVTAAQCRDLLARLDILGLRSAPRGGSVTLAVHAPVTGALLAVATRAELARAAGLPRRRRRHRRAPGRPTDTARHARAAEATDPPTATAPPTDGPGLTVPPDTHRYRPTVAQRRFVRARDRRCRWPGCRRPPARHDLDHARPHATGGPTACWNLCCLCRTHHRIKTFARHWRFDLLRDGRLLVTTPTGLTRISAPPGDRPDPGPPRLEASGAPDPPPF